MSSELPSKPAPATAEELRRIAFGRGSTDEERAAATKQLTELAAAESAPSLPGSAPAPVEGPDDEAGVVESDADTTATAANSAPLRRRSIAMIWLLPAVIASLAVGAIVGRATAPSPQVSAPAQVTLHRPLANLTSEPGKSTVGNLVAANAWLARAPTKADTFPSPAMTDNQGLSSVRHIKDIREDDTLITLWGAKDRDDGICLLAGLPGGFFTSSCVSPEVFAERSITLGFNGFEVGWDGVATSLTLPMSGVPN